MQGGAHCQCPTCRAWPRHHTSILVPGFTTVDSMAVLPAGSGGVWRAPAARPLCLRATWLAGRGTGGHRNDGRQPRFLHRCLGVLSRSMACLLDATSAPHVPLALQAAQRRVAHASSREQLAELQGVQKAALEQAERDAKALQGLAEVRGFSCLATGWQLEGQAGIEAAEAA